ncbi:D-alanyl-D-alanine carboxypeptidase family protein [Rhodosalinus sediminis]|jgi:D-alanyl-D-alanine carboxypeptidase (penicillin-binding protein 5/6)|uniref:D-alanyl-D-alanine carboxypeptidase family protein n=1 Tax=Rhodosalinus sediminis TaxID=1940533 RepID=UPI002355D584|nr:D-alanyl-D-alanine carboxypeptidase family protein [Rhodosalinus sediminis]
MTADALFRPLRAAAAAAVLVVAGLAATAAQAFDTQAEAAYVLDYNTGTVLLEKNADVPLPPASMSKLMTLYMLFEALRDVESLTLETRFTVSERATAMGGSSMFLQTSDRPTVEELIRGIVVQSGNDATVVVAEGLAGSEEAFAQLMNDRAEMLGMTDTHFENASGWPHPDHRMSMRDLGTLAARIIRDFPRRYAYFAEEKFEYDGRVPSNHFNRNPLLGLDIGADGLKTGHTEEAGYGLVGSAVQGERRVIFVVNGLPTREARAAEAQRILNWAFRQFVEKEVVAEGRPIAEAPVWMGAAETVGLVAAESRRMLLPVLAQDEVPGEVVYDAPVNAPIAAGDVLGELILSPEGLPEARVPLVADRDVPEGGFRQRVRTVGELLLERLGESAGDAL